MQNIFITSGECKNKDYSLAQQFGYIQKLQKKLQKSLELQLVIICHSTLHSLIKTSYTLQMVLAH